LNVAEEPFLSERHSGSGRWAVFDDTGVVAYLYLTSPTDDRIIADAWVYNRVEAPDFNNIEAYRPDPPPAAAGYATADAHVTTPASFSWSLTWSADGHSVALCADGVAWAFIRAGQAPGFSRHLARSGPWGEPWSDEIYAETFPSL
jgi:hypothetical protein